MWLRKQCSFVYYQNFWTDSAVFTAAMMGRINQPCLSQSPCLFFPAASHTSQKTGTNLDSYLPLKTNIMYQNSSQRQQLSYFFCGLRDDPDSHSENAASFQHCYYRKQQQDPESTISHPIITWLSHDFI